MAKFCFCFASIQLKLSSVFTDQFKIRRKFYLRRDRVQYEQTNVTMAGIFCVDYVSHWESDSSILTNTANLVSVKLISNSVAGVSLSAFLFPVSGIARSLCVLTTTEPSPVFSTFCVFGLVAQLLSSQHPTSSFILLLRHCQANAQPRSVTW